MNQESPFSPLLEQFFSSDLLPEDALDLMESHGFLTAINISPSQTDEPEWLSELFGVDSSDELNHPDVQKALCQLKAQIHRTLYSDSQLQLPCELDPGNDPEESDIRAWCVGFLAGHFLNEESWYERDEQLASELLLPLFVISGLFEEESEEFAEMARDANLVEDMCHQLPQVLTELYLHYQAPEEKPGFNSSASGKTGKSKPFGSNKR